MKFSKYIALGCTAVLAFAGTSCVGDLDVTPYDPNSRLELTTQEEWDGYLARLYWNLLDDSGDIVSTSDGGAGSFTRCHFNLQEVCADEFFISQKWNDPGYNTLNFNTWANNNEWVYAAFSREFTSAKMCAEFIRDFPEKGAKFYSEEEAKSRIAEAHVLRGLSYYYMIDLFGRGPWITESSVTGEIPPTYDRTQLFNAIVEELKAAIPDVKPAREQTYGRVCREAANMLLAKLYLNAEVYTGTPMWQQCADACKAVVSTGLELAPEYKYLFCSTNDRYVACNTMKGNYGEILWTVPQLQGRYTTWGGTTYLTCAAWIESAPAEVLASLNSGDTPWSGLRIRPELSKALRGDNRRMIFEGNYQEEIPDLASFDEFSDGYMLIKYTNTTEEDYLNTAGENNNGTAMSNTDYPIFRLADTYLMLAECQLHGVQCDGLNYLNKVRERAKMEPLAGLSETAILHERNVELYGEGCRRSDLVRFGKYTGGEYVWSWKGGVYEGASIDNYRALFAIPYQYMETVGQNPGY